MEKKELKMLEYLILQDYVWDHSWVRPYESSYSILRNFCRMNCVSELQAMKLINGSVISYIRNASRDFLMELHASKEQYDNVKRVLGCSKHYPEISGKGYSFLFTKEFKYCPVCLKEMHYHSDVFQLRSERTCPIHGCRLLEAGKAFMKYNAKRDDDLFNVANFPHPCIRKKTDFSKIGEEWHKYFGQNVTDAAIITSFTPECYQDRLKQIEDFTIQKIVLPLNQFPSNSYSEEIITSFLGACRYLEEVHPNKQNSSIEERSLQEEYINSLFQSERKYSTNYYGFMDSLLTGQLIASCLAGHCNPDCDIFPENDILKPLEIEEFSERFNAFNDSHLAIAYVQSVTGMKHPGNACSLKNLTSAEFDNQLHSGSINPVNMDHLDLFKDKELNDKIRKECQEDMFHELESLFGSIAREEARKGTKFKYYNLWKKLPPVIYIVSKYNETEFTINRYIASAARNEKEERKKPG